MIDADATPELPRSATGPVFREPWEAKAFAITVALHERGLFTWPEWARALTEQLDRARACGDPDPGDTYYQHWLAALETLVTAKGAASAGELSQLAEAWREAAERTPHGQPIELLRCETSDPGTAGRDSPCASEPQGFPTASGDSSAMRVQVPSAWRSSS